jgi:hypothetical protein
MYKSGGRGKGCFHLGIHRSCSLRPSPRVVLAIVPLFSELFLLPVLRFFVRSHGSPATSHHRRPIGMGALDGDAAGPELAGNRWPAGGERGWTVGRVDRAVGKGASAQPSERLSGQLRPLPRAGLHGAGKPFYAGSLPPLRRGAPQLCTEHDLAGSHIRWRLRGLPRDSGELGSLDSPLPRGAVHAADDGDEDSPRGACRRHVARRAEPAQGRLHPQHDDNQQRGLGAGVVLPPQRHARPPPPTPAWYSGRGPPPGTTGCPRPSTRRGWSRSWPP